MGHAVISPMIASDSLHFFTDPLNILHREWKNPWEPSAVSSDSFFDLLDAAQKDYQRLLALTFQLFVTPRHSDAEELRLRKILKQLGNLSYHSGLEGTEMW
jgi:hypothetical protein